MRVVTHVLTMESALMYRAVVLAAAAHVVMMVTDVSSQLLSAVTMDRSPLLLSV